MATPSSSTTTPSPRPMFLQAAVVVPPSVSASKEGPNDDDKERQNAIQKFLASAELSQLARGLRTRLAYASFKAANNLTRNTLPDLEAQAFSHATSAKSHSAKVPSNYYNNPATQGNGAVGNATSSKSSRKGAMAPPPLTASATQSLYASLLQPPPSKRARTIHNPQDPPLVSPQKALASTPPRKAAAGAGKGSRAPRSAQAKTKARKDEKGKRKQTPRHLASAKGRVTPQSTLGSEDFVDEDVDMKAAATLTSLLHSRPSKSASASSPRSTLSAGSDGGSYSHYAQSSTRSTAPTSQALSGEPSFTLPASFPRASTPPRGHTRTQSLPQQSSLRLNESTTPQGSFHRMGTPVPPSDTEAADLMLFLATSPSPVRPASKDAKDSTSLRTLSGSNALKGRVLFGQGSEDRNPRPLQRETTGSFSSITTELATEPGSQERITGAPATSSLLNPNHNRAGGSSSMLDVTASSVTAQPVPLQRPLTQLLPAPTSPTPAPRPRADVFERPRSLPAPGDMKFAAPPTPNSAFNISEYINVSPSPAGAGASKQTSLRANIGRRLFEEHHAGGDIVREGEPVPGSGLGAGIDLVQSQV